MQPSTRLFLLLAALLVAAQLVCATSHRSPSTALKARRFPRETTQSTHKHRLLAQLRVEYAPGGNWVESDPFPSSSASKQRFVLAARSSLASASSEIAATDLSSTTSINDETLLSAPLSSPSKATTSLASAPKPTLAVNSVPSVEPFTASGDLANVTPTSAPGSLVSPPESLSPASSSHSFVATADNATNPKPLLMVMPGRTLSVFPIGLFVFGSLNGIALLVTAYMFWERRCYARRFAERKRQENGASKSVQARGPTTSIPI
ncbi:hypothetical protein RHOSPDRAFT_34558 [Rhodotorula sp. JG-1b]|nr:hypothetical protein RHOSPDRAFT_34558 [Rhodotorula sp. JG-1b]